MTPDQINGAFELIGGTLVWFSIFRLLRDKEVKGVSVVPILFFNAWGLWNLAYYPSLEQWWSLAGAIWLSLSTLIQTGLMFYYSRRTKYEHEELHRLPDRDHRGGPPVPRSRHGGARVGLRS